MRILFIADGRSPIALNWIRYIAGQEHQVHLVSTFPCNPDLPLASLDIIPVALSQATAWEQQTGSSTHANTLRRLIPVRLRTAIRQRIAPLTFKSAEQKLRAIIAGVEPDLVHAMRIPYEGMLATLAEPRSPLLVSIWGNDFTLHASANRQMENLTRQVMARADALHADCRRDIRLAKVWGFSPHAPSIVLPGGGGVQADLFYLAEEKDINLVINPRGMRAYVRNDAFFKAIPRVLARRPNTRFICPTMAGEKQAETWVDRLGIGDAVTLLPRQSREEMAAHFRRAQVAVSPSTHDGTPNTLLEAMACGCLPVAGDLESLREWITPGENGLLIDPGDPQSLATAILAALDDHALQARARTINQELIRERAEYRQVMRSAERFYQRLVQRA